jgi:hypothetical protein
MLAQHPHDQDLLREELVKAFPDKDKFNPTFDEINSLEYLNCIIKETLRLYNPGIIFNLTNSNFYKIIFINLLYPIIVMMTRRINTKDKVFGEYFIPKVCTVTIYLLFIYCLERSERLLFFMYSTMKGEN